MRASGTALATLALLVGVASCDLTSSAPSWEAVWEAPSPEVTVSAADLLPEELTVSEDGSAFELLQAGSRTEFALGDMCAECAEGNGAVRPKPSFSVGRTLPMNFPTGIRQASVVGGEAVVAVRNHLPFDPIRPGGEAAGALRVAITDSRATPDTLASARLAGDEASLPPGRIVTETMEVMEGPIRPTLGTRVELQSPEGDSAWVDPEDRLTLEVGVQRLRMDGLLLPAGQSHSLEPLVLDVRDLNGETDGRVSDGRLEIEASNPFELPLDLALRLQGLEGDEVVTETLTLEPGATEAEVDLAQAALRSLLQSDTLQVEMTMEPKENRDLPLEPWHQLDLRGTLVVKVN